MLKISTTGRKEKRERNQYTEGKRQEGKQGKNDQSGTDRKEKRIRPIQGRKQTGKAGKKYSLFRKKACTHQARQDETSTKAYDHSSGHKKIALPLYQDDLYQDYFPTESIGFIRQSGIRIYSVYLAPFPIFFRFHFRLQLARFVLYRYAIRQNFAARKYR